MHLAHHCLQPAMAQPLLHHQENSFIRFGNDNLVRMQSHRGQARREKVRPLDYPQHHPF